MGNLRTIKFSKIVGELPANVQADTVYMVKKESGVYIYVTSEDAQSILPIMADEQKDTILLGTDKTAVTPGGQLTYTIANYDRDKSYSVYCTGGSIVRFGATIVYTAGTKESNFEITVNGRTFDIYVTTSIYQTVPVIVDNLSSTVSSTFTLEATSFDEFSLEGTITDAVWDIREDRVFGQDVTAESSISRNNNKATITVPWPGLYFIRVRYTDNNSKSTAWSKYLAVEVV